MVHSLYARRPHGFPFGGVELRDEEVLSEHMLGKRAPEAEGDHFVVTIQLIMMSPRYDNTTLSWRTFQSFNPSQRMGAGGFGTKVKRWQFWLSVPNDAPGPGTYDAHLPEAPEAKQGSAFASQTKRGAYLPKAQTPGAGEYDPAMAQEKINGGDSMFKNKDERFKKSMELEYAAHVGPGSYAQADRTVELDFKKSSGKVSSAIASTSLRADSFLPGA